ncbi:MAG: hypothetical protein MHPSP_003365, partial [Paramarteilia canceri]
SSKTSEALNTTLAGTLKGYRIFPQPHFQTPQKYVGNDYLCHEKITLHSYSDKKDKSVLLLSSLYSNADLSADQ